MTNHSTPSFLESCATLVPFPLTCFLELPSERWEKLEKLRDELSPLVSRFWEVQPLAEGDSFFFYHGAKFLRWCRGLGTTVTLSLPWSRLSEDRIRAAVEGGLHRLVFNAGGSATGFADGAPSAAALTKAVETIRRFQAREGTALPRLRLEIPAGAESSRPAGLVERAVALGIREIAGGEEESPGKNGSPLSLFPRSPGWKARLKRWLIKEYNPEDLFSFSSLREEGEKRKKCGFPWDSARVTREGEIKPCPVSPRVMGRLEGSSFEEIWNGKAYRDFRWSLLSDFPPEECRTCRWRGWFSPYAVERWIWAGINDRFGVQLGTGWHEREEGRPYRWSRKEAFFRLKNAGGEKLKMVLHLPSSKLAQEGEVFIDGEKAGEFSLRRAGDRLLSFPLPAGAGEEVLVKLVARREIVPRDVLGNDDLRRLGVAWKGAFLDR